MFTQCPNCKTIFSVSSEQLSIAKGTVRCGLCQELFQADQNLVQKKVKKRRHVTSKPHTDDSSPTGQTQPDNPQQTQDISTLYLEETEPQDKPKSSLVFALLSGITGLLLLAQLVLLTGHDWLPGKLQNGVCGIFHCVREPVPRDLSAIEVVTRGVYSHPSHHGALMVSATIINHADFAQPYPNVGLILLDIHGEPVAGREFKPNDYMKGPYNPNQQMDKNQQVAINLEIADPGQQVIGYEFSFF